MTTPVKPPSRVEVVGFPIFSMSWYGDPGKGTSIVAYSGGGGSARTGVKNCIAVQVDDNPEPIQLSTGTKLGAVVYTYGNPLTGQIWMLVAFSLGKLSMGSEVVRYSLPDCTPRGVLKVESACNAVAVNAIADRVALGCEDGTVRVYELNDSVFAGTEEDDLTPLPPLFVCHKHTEAVCAVSFSSRGNKLLSSAKDGTACVWQASEGMFLCQVQCVVDEQKTASSSRQNTRRNQPNAAGKKPASSPQVLVRGCAFGDVEGNLFYTVASAKRGAAFLARFQQDPKQQTHAEYRLVDRIVCSSCPVSAMALSLDGGLLVLGSVDGNVMLWSTSTWQPLKIFREVHGLPLTSVAPRPYRTELRGEDDGIQIHARTGSADGTLGCLTLMDRVPGHSSITSIVGADEGGLLQFIHRAIIWLLVMVIVLPIFIDAREKCDLQHTAIPNAWRCFLDDVLIAPKWKPGIASPPY